MVLTRTENSKNDIKPSVFMTKTQDTHAKMIKIVICGKDEIFKR